jgi:hypothetical protein
MSLMAVCAYYGSVQPSEFEELDYLVARELAQRLVDLRKDELEANQKLHLELAKAQIKATGARIT